jgi:hypothetical protein
MEDMKMTASVLYTRFSGVQDNRLKSPFSVHSEIQSVTPSQAQMWLTENNYEKQRRIRARHVEYLAEEMRRGNFRQGTQIHFAEYEGKLHLVNGQHTLAAIEKSQISQILDVCFTHEDPKDAYYRHDVGLKRTASDMFSSLQVADEFGFSATQVNFISASVRFISTGFGNPDGNKSRQLHPDEHISLFREYADAAGLYFEVSAGHGRHMRRAVNRSATMSVAIATYRFAYSANETQVEDFWQGAIFGNGLRSGDPRKAANVHLLSTEVKGGIGRNTMSSAKSSRYLAQCWNAWTEGRSIQYTRVFNDKSTIVINGTPWDGKAV